MSYIIGVIQWSIVAIIMVLSTLLFPILWILSIPPFKPLKRSFLDWLSPSWLKFAMFLSGSRVTIIGKENIPESKDYCVVSNHQSGFDIPVIFSVIPSVIGFVAKKELKTLPIAGWWMQTIGCIFLDRSNRRQAVEVMEEAAQTVRDFHPMAIFPEGTRSKGGPVAHFKQGALKFGIKANRKILPISLQDTYKIMENKGHKINRVNIVVTIHPAIEVSKLTEDETKLLADTLQKTISSAVSFTS
jgi:1-acyl-sn-glycerol-3-phosphate acyltransferase